MFLLLNEKEAIDFTKIRNIRMIGPVLGGPIYKGTISIYFDETLVELYQLGESFNVTNDKKQELREKDSIFGKSFVFEMDPVNRKILEILTPIAENYFKHLIVDLQVKVDMGILLYDVNFDFKEYVNAEYPDLKERLLQIDGVELKKDSKADAI